MLILTVGLEAYIPSPSGELPVDIQRPERGQIAAKNQPGRPHCRRLPQRSQAKATECLWFVLTVA